MLVPCTCEWACNSNTELHCPKITVLRPINAKRPSITATELTLEIFHAKEYSFNHWPKSRVTMQESTWVQQSAYLFYNVSQTELDRIWIGWCQVADFRLPPAVRMTCAFSVCKLKSVYILRLVVIPFFLVSFFFNRYFFHIMPLRSSSSQALGSSDLQRRSTAGASGSASPWDSIDDLQEPVLPWMQGANASRQSIGSFMTRSSLDSNARESLHVVKRYQRELDEGRKNKRWTKFKWWLLMTNSLVSPPNLFQ